LPRPGGQTVGIARSAWLGRRTRQGRTTAVKQIFRLARAGSGRAGNQVERLKYRPVSQRIDESVALKHPVDEAQRVERAEVPGDVLVRSHRRRCQLRDRALSPADQLEEKQSSRITQHAGMVTNWAEACEPDRGLQEPGIACRITVRHRSRDSRSRDPSRPGVPTPDQGSPYQGQDHDCSEGVQRVARAGAPSGRRPAREDRRRLGRERPP
jgi:hypothetical protein